MRPLHRLAREAARSAEPESILSALEEAVKDAIAADVVHLLNITQDHTGAISSHADVHLADGKPSGTARVLATGRPFLVPDARTSTEIRPGQAEEHGIASFLFVPVVWGDDIRGVLVIGWHEATDITPEYVADAQLAADQAASGFARLETEERRAGGAAQDRAVVRAGRALNATLDLQEILLTLVHEAALALEADFTGVYLGNTEDGAIATAGCA